MWRSGSASPCQGEGRRFESGHPLGSKDQNVGSGYTAKAYRARPTIASLAQWTEHLTSDQAVARSTRARGSQ